MQTDMMRIRLPADVKARLAARAKENGRSMNSEVLIILKGTIDPTPAKSAKDAHKVTA
jgi:plasmid stability protein